MPFGNEDPIDRRHKERIRELEAALDRAVQALADSSTTIRRKQQIVDYGREVLKRG
jgi:hypothetical protein